MKIETFELEQQDEADYIYGVRLTGSSVDENPIIIEVARLLGMPTPKGPAGQPLSLETTGWELGNFRGGGGTTVANSSSTGSNKKQVAKEKLQKSSIDMIQLMFDELQQRIIRETLASTPPSSAETSPRSKGPEEKKEIAPGLFFSEKRTSPIRRSPTRPDLKLQGQVFIDPAKLSNTGGELDTLKMSIDQTIHARACIYWPSPEGTAELKQAAEGFMEFLQSLESHPDGEALIIGLGARMFGHEGLLPDATYIEQTKFRQLAYGSGPQSTSSEEKVDPEQARYKSELSRHCDGLFSHVMYKIMSQKQEDAPELGHYRAVLIALLGDVGAFMTATGATTGTERPDWVSHGLKKAFGDFALRSEGLDPVLDESQDILKKSLERSTKLGGGKTVGPTKSDERKRMPEGAEELIARSGVHDTGEDVDEALGRLGKKGHLPKTKWASARLLEERLTIEPSAGGPSASPSEILWAWDILSKRGLRAAYAGPEKGDTAPPASHARAALTGAFLGGLGYHPAIETVHGTLAYLGQSPDAVLREEAEKQGRPADARLLFHDGAATALMKDLYQGETSKTGLAMITPSLEEDTTPKATR